MNLVTEQPDPVKTCRSCNEEKPLSAFRRFKTCHDGHAATCKKCLSHRANDKKRGQPRKPRVSPFPEYTEKRCARCQKVRPVSEFYKSPRDGYGSQCPPCRKERRQELKAKNPEMYLARSRKAYAKFVRENPATAKEQFRRYNLRKNIRRYCGMTLEQYDALVIKQEGLCAICKQPETVRRSRNNPDVRPLHVDHCHVSNKFRGLLCSKCNTAIGLLREDVSIITACIDYLEKHKEAAA